MAGTTAGLVPVENDPERISHCKHEELSLTIREHERTLPKGGNSEAGKSDA
jgi:hypothetical protein